MGASAAEEALELALAALSRKDRTVAELRSLLARRGCEPAAREAAIARLAELGALDDARFARAFAVGKRELRGWGPARIRRALEARGIAAELAAAAAGEDAGGEAAVERASALLRERGEPLDGDAARARAFGFLVRRGYDHETAYAAIRRAASAA